MSLGNINVQPTVFPVCPTCNASYVLRRAICLSTGPHSRIDEQWVWQRDCKHKAPPEIVDNRPKKKKPVPTIDVRKKR